MNAYSLFLLSKSELKTRSMKYMEFSALCSNFIPQPQTDRCIFLQYLYICMQTSIVKLKRFKSWYCACAQQQYHITVKAVYTESPWDQLQCQEQTDVRFPTLGLYSVYTVFCFIKDSGQTVFTVVLPELANMLRLQIKFFWYVLMASI